jgi:hypothetical protein
VFPVRYGFGFYIPGNEETTFFIKNGVFWDVTPCGSCKNRRFGGTWRWFSQEPHGVTSQKTPFFIVTAVKISNLTIFFIVSAVKTSNLTKFGVDSIKISLVSSNGLQSLIT